VDPGDAITCTYTNTKDASVRITKNAIPDGAQDFTFTGTGGGPAPWASFLLDDDADATLPNTRLFIFPAALQGMKTMTESAVAGWDLTALSCTGGGGNTSVNLATRVATIGVDPGEVIECVYTNTQRGMVQLTKTILGAPITGTESFLFELRQGANATDDRGTLIDTATANSGNGGSVMFAGKYIPGTYQFCEVLEMPGWSTSLSSASGAFTLFNPLQANDTTVCVPFTLDPGETESFTVDNAPPPGGPTLTIGFWKNHASCRTSNGHQTPELDIVLASAEPGGIAIGDLILHGGPTAEEAVDCLKARNILDKRTIDTATKQASNPAFNVAAQLLAAKLNVQSQAAQLGCANQAIADAQALLDLLNFDGTQNWVNTVVISAADAATLNTLNGILDAYNNGNLVCPPAPTPVF
jgi:hypothetical protein